MIDVPFARLTVGDVAQLGVRGVVSSRDELDQSSYEPVVRHWLAPVWPAEVLVPQRVDEVVERLNLRIGVMAAARAAITISLRLTSALAPR